MLSASIRIANRMMSHAALRSFNCQPALKGALIHGSHLAYPRPRTHTPTIVNSWTPFASLGLGKVSSAEGESASSQARNFASAVDSTSTVDAPTSPAESSSGSGRDNTDNSEARRQPRGVDEDASLVLISGAFDQPHPEKEAKGGEDAHFMSSNQRVIGVADGVGGWAESQIDAGIYARMLMAFCKDAAESGGPISSEPKKIIETAYHKTKVQGSSTACVLCLNKNVLHSANLGDSGFVLIRGGKALYIAQPQQHQFNFPYQLCTMQKENGDPPESAEVWQGAVEAGDVIITATDGLWDNVFVDDMISIVTQVKLAGHSPDVAAKLLGKYARMRAADDQYHSPFSAQAYRSGMFLLGGKMDDITILVSYVEPMSKL